MLQSAEAMDKCSARWTYVTTNYKTLF